MTQMEFKFFSEKASCKTTSLLDVYGKEPVRIQPYLDKNNYLLVKYSLLSPLLDSDNLIKLVLNRTSFGLTMNSEIFQTTNISKKQGELIYGPLADNYGYSFNLKSCDVKYGDCISSLPVYYSLSKKTPQNVSGLTFDLIDSRFVVLKWKKPSISNDFFLSYKIFRRQACNESLNPNELVTEKSESTVNCSGIILKKKEGSECCGKNYHNPTKENKKCCGGKIYSALPGYQCCGNIYYIHVPVGQICCSFKSKDFGLKIGNGNTCCGSQPYYNSSKVQKCCETKVVAKKLIIPKNEYYSNICTVHKKDINLDACSKFDQIITTTNLFLNDTGLIPDESYNYKLCVNNSFSTECNKRLFKVRTLKSLPQGFGFFSYKMLNDRIVFIWNEPIHFNGKIERYIVLRDGNEVYNGLALFYVEKKSILEDYQAYKYEVMNIYELTRLYLLI